MKLECKAIGAAVVAAALFLTTTTHSLAESGAIPLDQLGAVATKQVEGDSLSIKAFPNGARLRCAFQRLEAEATLPSWGRRRGWTGGDCGSLNEPGGLDTDPDQHRRYRSLLLSRFGHDELQQAVLPGADR